ncbi:MAG: hypothetical protein AAFY11_03815 [Cyanobacteria bacterium J06641_5]
MGTLQISEKEISADLERARSVAGASFEWGGLKYDWVATYSEKMQAEAQQRCQDLQASKRGALMVCHGNGNVTVWQGPIDSFQVQVSESPMVAASSAVIPREIAQLEEMPSMPQTVTVKYRGQTVTRQVEATNRDRQREGQRSYRGRKY